MNYHYQITYSYSCHSEILGEFTDIDEAIKEYNQILNDWELAPHDQYLELEQVFDDYECDTVLYHEFNEGNWECED